MRTNEPAWDTKPSNPLGEKVTKPTPSKPEWKQIPGAEKGVGIGSDGKLSTHIPGNTL